MEPTTHSASHGPESPTPFQVDQLLESEGIDVAAYDQETRARTYEAIGCIPALLLRASEVERSATPQILAICESAGGALAGLDHRLKSPASLCRKIATIVSATEGVTAEMISVIVTDILRYTMLFPAPSYTAATKDAIERLGECGFRVLKVKNYWPEGNCYRGINSIWVEISGFRFEIQFHTPESFQLKEETLHPIYEKARQLEAVLSEGTEHRDTGVVEEIQTLKDQMRAESEKIALPKGAESIGQIVYDTGHDKTSGGAL